MILMPPQLVTIHLSYINGGVYIYATTTIYVEVFLASFCVIPNCPNLLENYRY